MEGSVEGSIEGSFEGSIEGSCDGFELGLLDGFLLGLLDGTREGIELRSCSVPVATEIYLEPVELVHVSNPARKSAKLSACTPLEFTLQKQEPPEPCRNRWE